MTSDAADRFVDLACLTYLDNESRERRDEARKLLAASPQLVHDSVHAAAAAGDLRALRMHVDRDPGCVQRVGTSRQWAPLLALCYSRVPQQDALACLDLLLERGADPDAFVAIGECRFSALTGVIGEGEAGPIEQPPHPDARVLAERLLDAGASPNDEQALYNTHFLPSNDWLELLLARGLSSERDFLLGQAAVQGFIERVRVLLAHGTPATGHNRYNKRTHLENALLEGHAEIAALLRAAGAHDAVLDDNERLRVAILANQETEARRIVASSPSTIAEADALAAAARHGRLDAVRLGLALGLPIDGRDAQGLTPLHHAARNGHLDVVRELVARGASQSVRDPLYDGTALGHARHFAGRWPHPDGAAIVALLEQQA